SGLHEEQRISGFVDGLKIRNLVDFLSIDLPTTYKGLMQKTYTWIEAMEVTTNGATSNYKEVLTSSTKVSLRIIEKSRRRTGIGTDDHETCASIVISMKTTDMKPINAESSNTRSKNL
ncbi:hypothetical protein Tco_0099899, partial [Tanacetum coccineum]